MIITQILISLFVLFALSRVVLRFSEDKISIVGLFGWVTLWLIVEIVVWLPNFTTSIAGILGIGRGADLIIYFSIVTLFYLVFRIYVKLEDLERQITFIVRSIALQKISRTKKKVKK